MSLVTPHQTDLTTFCKFKREHQLRRALHLLLNQKRLRQESLLYVSSVESSGRAAIRVRNPRVLFQ